MSEQEVKPLDMSRQPMGDPHPCDLTRAGFHPVTGKPLGVEEVTPQREGRCRVCDYAFYYDEPPDDNSHPKMCPDCVDAGEVGP